MQPLATLSQPDQGSVSLAYTAEIAAGALSYLQDTAVGAEIKLLEGYSMVAAVGAGVSNNPNHCYGFYQQLKNAPVEFMCESESGLSLVAILRKTDVAKLVVGIHSQLFQAQNVSPLLCVVKVISALVGWNSLPSKNQNWKSVAA